MKSEKNILIVDDDLDVLHLIMRVIRELDENFMVLSASNAADAFAIAVEYVPDIIITDWYMPGGSGIELIKRLKDDPITKDIPTIVATGVRVSPEDMSLALASGAVDYIRKPIVEVELQARVNSALLLSMSWKDSLRAKDAEIVENALYLTKTNEFLKSVQASLSILKAKDDKLNTIIAPIDEKIDEFLRSHAWDRFETSFQSLHGDFNRRLLERYPDLSPTDLKLSALLILGMSTKNLSAILSSTEGSIKVARHRLRKKLELGDKENLQTFLASV